LEANITSLLAKITMKHKSEKKFSPAQFLALSFLAAVAVGTGLFLLPFSTKTGHLKKPPTSQMMILS
jgi:hypothetical protein